MKIARTLTPPRGTRRVPGAGQHSPLVGLPVDAFDDRIAIVGTAGSGKTYAAKGFVERLLESGARVAIVDPLEGRSYPTSDLFRYRFLDLGNR